MVTARRKTQLYLSALAAVLVGFALVPSRLHAQNDPPRAGGTARDFVGTWHWMFQGKPFATMVIELHGDRFTGSITNESIHMDADGKITNATAGEGVSPIVRASLENGVLHVTGKDGEDEIEWLMVLKTADKGELRIGDADAPPNAEAISLERAR